jgi:hypothetical protein
MFALYAHSSRCYYRGVHETPDVNARKALKFTTAHDAKSEIDLLKMTGSWPLFTWTVVTLRSARS